MFNCATADGAPQFAGIHYLSRLGDNVNNWAVFEASGHAGSTVTDTYVENLDTTLIAADDALIEALRQLDVRIWDADTGRTLSA